VRFGQAAAEWGQAGNDGTTAVARRNSVRDPSVSLPARGGGIAQLRMSLLDGLRKHACFLLHSSGPEPTAGRQLTHIVYANQASKCSRRTAAVLAPASSRNTASIRCYIYAIHSCLRPHYATQKPSQKPCPLRVPSRRVHKCAHTTHAAQPPIGQLLQPAAPSAQPFRQRRPLRKKMQEAGLRTPACTLPSCRQGSSQLPPP